MIATGGHAQLLNGLIINEFLPDNEDSLESEWIELFNHSSGAIDMQGWQIGDELSLTNISDSSVIIEPFAYIILARDRDAFLNYYQSCSGAVIEPDGWPILNNSGDIVRLVNDEGAFIDSVSYEDGFGNNHSWERFLSNNGRSFWGPSYDSSGSSPGRPNSYFPKFDRVIDINAHPDPFSPDGDGFEDITVISYAPPPDGEFTLYIYDIAGNRIKTVLELAESIPGKIVWDGRDDSGRRQDIGIYILFARYVGESIVETKKTIVIAR